jgi:GNAT superfamily N-acetyltransferase
MVLFSCALPAEQAARPAGLSVERTNALTLPKAEYLSVFGAQNTGARERELATRFAAGSELWLARIEGRMAAFGWTIRGSTIAPHFFPIQPDEVHFFDFFVAPEFRGCGVNVVLMMEVLTRLNEEQVRCAHLECAAWNAAQLRSLSRTVFRRNGVASMVRVFGRSLVIWHLR